MSIYLGLARARLGPAAAIIDPRHGVAACEENRLTRARQAPTSGPPALAIAELLSYLGHTESAIEAVGVVRDPEQPDWHQGSGGIIEVDAHRAHADYAFRASGFDSALVVVCDATAAQGYSAWTYQESHVRSLDSVGDFPIAEVYGAMTAALGLRAARDEHLVEAMARAGRGDGRAADWIDITPQGMSTARGFQQAIADVCHASGDRAATGRDVAAAVQRRLGSCLTELLSRLSRASGARQLCLSGGLFFNTQFTTTAAHAAAFEEVFVPAHPGRSGSAIGAALGAMAGDLSRPSPTVPRAIGSAYLGPGYSAAEVKEALDNCKLVYDLQREEQVIDTVLQALSHGRLAGWFHGRLEWGPRALGHRTVLADPFAPHVLENLNGYLKKRPSYRSYGISVPLSKLHDLFETPRPEGSSRSASPFMQYEYRPRDLDQFRTILPKGVETLRVHTVDDSEPLYLRLLERWGEMSGVPALVNTSFNGFHEPLVCSPRDAVRVFYGTGLDLLAIEGFVLRK
jgi:carbamoyltransferase